VSAPKEIADLWPAVEQAAPDDPLPLLVAADKCAELHAATNPPWWVSQLEFALRWCAGRNRRPVKTGYVRHEWMWICKRKKGQYRTVTGGQLKRDECCVLPRLVFEAFAGTCEFDRWRTSFTAYDYLMKGLEDLGAALRAPKLTLPPPPEVVRAAPVTCASCGVMRARTRFQCPVCHSNEIQS